MSTGIKRLIRIAGAGILLALIAIIAVIALVDVEKHRGRIESAVSDALGMDFRVKGHISVSVIPVTGIKMDDITLAKGGKPVISAGGLRVGVALMPLLKKEVRADRFELIKPVISIERGPGGRFNFEKTGKQSREEDSRKGRFSIDEFNVLDGVLSFTDRKRGEKVEVEGLEIVIKDFVLNRGKSSDLLKSISFAGRVKAETLKANEIVSENIRGEIKAKDGMIVIDPLTMDIFSGRGKSAVTINMAPAVPAYQIDYRLSGFRIEKFLEAVARKHLLNGKMDFSLQLSAKGRDFRAIKQNMNGEISLRGEDLILYNLDIDRLLVKYEKSQTFNLVDVGAFIFAGPVGTAVTKGYDFTGIYRQTRKGEQGTVSRIVSVWKIRDGIAEADDVAFTTKRNRIAVKGRANFVNERFDNITVALLDKKGCAKYRQKITGTFRNPRIEKANMLVSIAGPVLKLFKKTKDFVEPGGQCRVFYSGSVSHPF